MNLKQFLIGTLIGIIFICGIMLLSFSFGWFGVGYTKTVGKAQRNAETEVFKNSQTYVDGVVTNFEKQKLAYTLSKDSVERKAIAMYMITTCLLYTSPSPRD